MTNYVKNRPNVTTGPLFFEWTVKFHNIVNRQTSKHKQLYSTIQAYNIHGMTLNAKKLKRLLSTLYQESKYGTIPSQYLQIFIDTLTYLSRKTQPGWSLAVSQDIKTKR